MMHFYIRRLHCAPCSGHFALSHSVCLHIALNYFFCFCTFLYVVQESIPVNSQLPGPLIHPNTRGARRGARRFQEGLVPSAIGATQTKRTLGNLRGRATAKCPQVHFSIGCFLTEEALSNHAASYFVRLVTSSLLRLVRSE